MEFKKDRITLSFDKFKEYLYNLNIDINIELLNLLCHKDYIVANDKNSYICKLKYSEERIKKAKTERLKSKSKKIESSIDVNKSINYLSKENDNKELHVEDLNVNKKEDEICESPIEEHVKDNEIFSQNTQTAKTSSYLFYEKPIDIEKTKYIDDDIEVPDNIVDVYEELEIKDQIIDKMETDITKLREEIVVKDNQISDLKSNSFIINKIHEVNKLLFRKSKLDEKVNAFIISLENISNKKVINFINGRIVNLKKDVKDINILTKLIKDNMDKLLFNN